MSSKEAKVRVADLPRLTIAEGSIDPVADIAHGKYTAEEMQRGAEVLPGDEVYTEAATWPVPNQCVDGRGLESLGPNAAGGTTTLVVADALTHDSYRQPGEKAPAHAKRLFSFLNQAGYKIGGHIDEHRHGSACGCGAQDKLLPLLDYMHKRGNDIRTFLQSLKYTLTDEPLGMQVADGTHDVITEKAAELEAEGYAATGEEIHEAFVEVAGEESTPALPGEHTEAFLVIDTRSGKTFDRAKFAERTGGRVKAFYVNVAGIQEACALLSNSVAEATEKSMGALYYNVATAAVLAGTSMRIIVR